MAYRSLVQEVRDKSSEAEDIFNQIKDEICSKFELKELLLCTKRLGEIKYILNDDSSSLEIRSATDKILDYFTRRNELDRLVVFFSKSKPYFPSNNLKAQLECYIDFNKDWNISIPSFDVDIDYKFVIDDYLAMKLDRTEHKDAFIDYYDNNNEPHIFFNLFYGNKNQGLRFFTKRLKKEIIPGKIRNKEMEQDIEEIEFVEVVEFKWDFYRKDKEKAESSLHSSISKKLQKSNMIRQKKKMIKNKDIKNYKELLQKALEEKAQNKDLLIFCEINLPVWSTKYSSYLDLCIDFFSSIKTENFIIVSLILQTDFSVSSWWQRILKKNDTENFKCFISSFKNHLAHGVILPELESVKKEHIQDWIDEDVKKWIKKNKNYQKFEEIITLKMSEEINKKTAKEFPFNDFILNIENDFSKIFTKFDLQK